MLKHLGILSIDTLKDLVDKEMSKRDLFQGLKTRGIKDEDINNILELARV